MISAWRFMAIYVMIITILPQIAAQNMENRPFFTDRRLQDIFPYITDEEYVRYICSMVNADSHREDSKNKLVAKTNALIDTKYRTWKRNADLINSLLALPKGMDEAGR